ncbi:MAG: hypothetical protein BGO33_05485 [Bacteroidia bacterium 43-41]|nr:MAG: hypothetical protein BGO33_05485 [Bacteroidia bacterium 43-41]
MSRYETYKPSCIDWIGNVPEHWETVRIKNVASIVNGSTPSSSVEEYWDGDIIWATPGDFNKYEKIIDDSESKITEAGYKSCGTSLVPVGSVVITTRAPIGNVLIAGKELCTNQGCKTLVPNRIESRFLYYIISISSIELNVLGQGTTFLELSKESLGTFKLPLPDFDEQLAIANYLDHQTQKIDCLIANKKAQAEKLKELRQIEINNAVTKGLNPNAEMKDSGIEWLGKIPKHWEVKRLKNILIEKMMYGANEIADDDNENNPRYIRITDFGSNGELRDDTFKSLPMEVAKDYLLREGDILFARSGATVGKTFQFKNYSGIACFAGYLIKARANNQIITSDFLFYFTQSNAYENWKNSIFSKATIENIGADKYQLLKLCVPNSIEEQNEITEYLIKRTTAIDQLIKNIEAQIEKLQELRKIKIYEAVTGKIKVNRYE